ncbi:MAG: ArsA family ATPase, partial [Myxococcales bacterium]|nr:ArsA family ATPase [Myxococcales bacterium]
TIDPARRLAQAIGLEALTGELRRVEPALFAAAGLEAPGELWAMMLDTKTTGDQMVRRFAPNPQMARRILDNTYYKYFSTSLSGAQEYMAIEQVRALVEEGGFDLVILDTPPAVHAMDFLEAPDRMLDALDSSAIQVLVKSQQVSDNLAGRLIGKGRGLVLRSLDRMTGGPFLEDLGEFLAVFATILDALKHASERLKALLRADDSRFCLVTSPKRSNVDEAMHFQAELAERGFNFEGFIVNRVHMHYPDTGTGPEHDGHLLGELAGLLPELTDGERGALLQGMRRAFSAHNNMADRDGRAIEHLAGAAGEAPVRVPLMPLDVRDLAALHRVGRWLLKA